MERMADFKIGSFPSLIFGGGLMILGARIEALLAQASTNPVEAALYKSTEALFFAIAGSMTIGTVQNYIDRSFDSAISHAFKNGF